MSHPKKTYKQTKTAIWCCNYFLCNALHAPITRLHQTKQTDGDICTASISPRNIRKEKKPGWKTRTRDIWVNCPFKCRRQIHLVASLSCGWFYSRGNQLSAQFLTFCSHKATQVQVTSCCCYLKQPVEFCPVLCLFWFWFWAPQCPTVDKT